MNDYTSKDHTFVICAYGESKYLSHCIDSLLAQKTRSNIIISTSTPNGHIQSLAEKYSIELRINIQPPSISSDWNFAYKQAGTKLITLAHQDDVYLPDYLSTVLEMVNKATNPIIFFSHYGEAVGDEVCYKNLRLGIKILMLKPMKIWGKSRFIRRVLLSFGNPICCPSVTFVGLEDMEFTDELTCCLDWHKWEELSRLQGSFVYCEKPLLHHRLHKDAETSKAIHGGTRRQEDYLMFRKFWCTPIAKVLTKLYSKSEEGNG